MAKREATLRVNFGIYELDEEEPLGWFAKDIIRTVELLLQHAGGQDPHLESKDLSALGNLLEWGRKCQEYHGIEGDQGERERLAEQRAEGGKGKAA